MTAPWRKTNFTTTVTGTDASPAPACPRRVQGRRRRDRHDPPASRSPPRARTRSRPASSTSPATSPTGATDTIGIDKTVPTLSVDCGADAWRNTPATCTVAADGGVSGLATLTAARGAGAAEAIRRQLHRRRRRRLERDLPRRRRRRQRDDRHGRRQDRPHAARRVRQLRGRHRHGVVLQGHAAPTRVSGVTGVR